LIVPLSGAAGAGSASSAQLAASALVRGDTSQAVVSYTEALNDTSLTALREAGLTPDDIRRMVELD